MAQCPSCQTELNDDFGIVDCPSCGAALFLEMDGQVRRRDASALNEEPQAQRVVREDSFTPTEDVGAGFDEAPGFDPTHVLQEIPGEEPGFAESVPFPSDEFAPEAPMEPLPPMALAEAEPPAGGSVLSDLAAFGNSQDSAGREGPYFYDMVIFGIDSADIRRDVQDALTDQLFLWDAEALLKQLNLGQLNMPRMTSVKAALVVQRLTGLPVRIRWTQHALAEA